MRVTKEEVDKAGEEWVAAVVATKGLVGAAYLTAVKAVEAAWNKYIKLKEEFENESN